MHCDRVSHAQPEWFGIWHDDCLPDFICESVYDEQSNAVPFRDDNAEFNTDADIQPVADVQRVPES